MFDCAEKLWGIKMVPMKDAPKYIEDMEVYDVVDAKTGEHVAVWMCDYVPRDSKRQGAWMEQLQSCGLFEDGKERRPIVYNVGNFTRPAGDVPALLTIDEVETTFHEFGRSSCSTFCVGATIQAVRLQIQRENAETTYRPTRTLGEK